jgi:hypothetical protein
MICAYLTAYDCKEDCSLYALDAGFLVAAGYTLNSLQVIELLLFNSDND